MNKRNRVFLIISMVSYMFTVLAVFLLVLALINISKAQATYEEAYDCWWNGTGTIPYSNYNVVPGVSNSASSAYSSSSEAFRAMNAADARKSGFIFLAVFSVFMMVSSFILGTVFTTIRKKKVSEKTDESVETAGKNFSEIHEAVMDNLRGGTEFVCPYCGSSIFLKDKTNLICPHCGATLEKKNKE